MSTKDERRGFTLMEVTLTVGILAILLTLTLSISKNAIGRSGLRTAENIIIQTLRRAQVLSQNNVIGPSVTSGSQWGVYIDTGSVILFARDKYDDPMPADDRTFAINPRISFTGSLIKKMHFLSGGSKGVGIVFERFTGEPTPSNFSGTILIQMDGDTRTLIMNGKGVVERN